MQYEKGYTVEHSEKIAPFPVHSVVAGRQVGTVRDSVTAYSLEILYGTEYFHCLHRPHYPVMDTQRLTIRSGGTIRRRNQTAVSDSEPITQT